MDFVKKHPKIALAAGVGVAAVLVWAVVGGSGGGGGGAVIYGGPSDAVTASQAGAYAATVQAQAELNARVTEVQAQENVALAQAYYANSAQTREAAVMALMINRQAEVAFRDQERDVAIARLGVQLGETQASSAIQIANIEAQRDIKLGEWEMQAAKKESAEATKRNRSNAIKGILGSIFSDATLKTDVRYMFTDARGQRWYRYRYEGDTTYHYGVIAQETDARYVSRVHGKLAVNYEGLAAAA